MLRIYEVAIECVADMQPIVKAIKRQDPHLGDDMDRALTSVPQHIAEGSQARGRRRLNSYSNGAQEMTEAISCVRTAVAKGIIRMPEEQRIERMRSVVRVLVKNIYR